MKKTTKRLHLCRETLRNLENPALRRAAGGVNTFNDYTTCACTDGCNQPTEGCQGTAACGSDMCTYQDLTTCVC
ncbi:MAG TPA: hypothetical protein VMM92_16625 [Thermoanaerobaculia bacterium]|nr:hypothetical protein [Thermoanaerobaculia bacterium]